MLQPPAAPDRSRADLVVVTTTCYRSEDDPRLALAEATARAAAELNLRVIAVDASAPECAARLLAAGFDVRPQRGAGRKGHALRQAIAAAVEAGAAAVAFQEPEKTGMVGLQRAAAAPVLNGEADVVLPARDAALFAQTYAVEQWHSESFGNGLVNAAARAAGMGAGELDWFFGPLCLSAVAAAPVWLAHEGELWDAQLAPVVQAWRAGLRVASVPVAYRHPPEQKAQEEGSVEWASKRLAQLNAVAPLLVGMLSAAGSSGDGLSSGSSGSSGEGAGEA